MINEQITKAINHEQEERAKRKRSGKQNPSSFGRCFRYQYWNRKNEELSNPIPVATLKAFKVGSVLHELIQSSFHKDFVEVLCETEDVKGYADLITNEAVIDIKTVNANAFRHYKAKKGEGYIAWAKRLSEKKEEHLLQVCFYAMMLKKQYATVAYVSKDDLFCLELTVTACHWAQKVEEEIRINQGFWTKDKLPPALPRAYDGKECQYCGFFDKCKSLEIKTVIDS